MYSDVCAFSIFLFIMFVADDLPRLVNKVFVRWSSGDHGGVS